MSWSHSVMKRSSGRDLEAEADTAAVKEWCLLACSPLSLYLLPSSNTWSCHCLSCLLYLYSHYLCCCCCCCRSRSLRIQTCQLPPHRETNGLIKSLFFYFTNKDPGTRCWSINLLPQRSRESSQCTSPIISERHHTLLCLKTKLPQRMSLSFYFLYLSFSDLQVFPSYSVVTSN